MKQLVGRLNPLCKKALEEAAHLCVAQGHYSIDVPHILTKIMLDPKSDFFNLCAHYGLDCDKLKGDLERLLKRYEKGNSATPSLSPNVLTLLEQAWMVTSVDLGVEKIRSGAFLYVLLDGKGLLGWSADNLSSLVSIPRQEFQGEWKRLLSQMPESEKKTTVRPPQKEGDISATYATEYLEKYTTNLTQQARDKKLSPIWGREKQVRQVIDVLARSRQNNPILVGEAGVGKTAIVEGIAMMIEQKALPDFLQSCEIFVLDIGLLEAGAGVQGEFEDRLKGVIAEIQALPFEAIVFIDEAHMLLGGDNKKHDAANLLKPALARGELRTIAATTWEEYKKYFEKDPALTRRFQAVQVPEPSDEEACQMLRAMTVYLEEKHNVVILSDALVAAVQLSRRYIGDRRLPDKAVSVLDTACARVKLSQKMAPLALEEAQKKRESLMKEEQHLLRDEKSGIECASRIAMVRGDLKSVDTLIDTLSQQWRKEKALIAELEQSYKDDKGAKVLQGINKKIADVRSNAEGMVFSWVCADMVASIIASWTGVPVGKMLKDESKAFLNIAPTLAERVIGQKGAVQVIADTMMAHKAQLDDPDKPLGVFFLVGPSGVGKTETALALAEYFFGGSHNAIVINMSEYQEAHTVSLLKGSPPGYVGYGQGGVLTEAVRRQPYSVVLLDEIEKAHPDVIELFYQVFDKGVLEDGSGVRVDFKNTLIIMTSNTATEAIVKLATAKTSAHDVVKAIYPELKSVFKPAFLGRTCVVPYYPLTKEEMDSIALLKWTKVANRMHQHHNVTVSLDKSAYERLVEEGVSEDSGARAIDALLNRFVVPELARFILKSQAAEKELKPLVISVFNQKFIVKEA
ncbi:MAG: type VI secretion system ATPase TssH [Alphaproteobacteria bacterium]|nr:type VI secretion system ATPase TssH [Alphaproteobacteria bacterium]